MDFLRGQEAFLSLISSMDKDFVIPLLKWIQSASVDLIKDSGRCNNTDGIIQQIQCDLRAMVPFSAVLPSEDIQPPAVFEESEKDGIDLVSKIVHVDGFLYDDVEIDELCDAGQMSRNYCVNCGSHKVAPLTFVSHSTSLTQLKYIFYYLLQSLNGKVVLDVGSRLGSVLYGAYLYSNASSIIGCEMNLDLWHVQHMIIEKYHLSDRIKIICADIMTQDEILKIADVIILNNVFEHFLPINEQRRIWQFLRLAIVRRGTLIVMSPSIEESLQPLETGIDASNWMQKLDTSSCLTDANWNLFGCDESEDSDLEGIHLYSVL